MNGVQTFLGDLGLCQYYDMFVIKGFDSENDLAYLDAKDLDAMYITDTDHRKQILDAGNTLGHCNTTLMSMLDLYVWTCENKHNTCRYIQQSSNAKFKIGSQVIL